jgi:uncharacterized protein YukJ
MPLRRYGVLVGRAVASRAEGGTDTPHFQIHLRGGGEDFWVAVNVLSQQSPPELLYLAVDNFTHPVLAQLTGLQDGYAEIKSVAGGLALDLIRGNLFERSQLQPMPAASPGPDNDLADRLAHFTNRAVNDPDSRVYAFGERWGPEATKDKVFGFSPGSGIHDIHMNQGNNGQFVRDDGVWQDGALLFHFPGTAQWVAVFLAFQSQSWHTDDITGHALPGVPGPIPGPADPHGSVRIVAALVNPIGPAPEPETVTLLNPGAAPVDLTGWSLADRLDHRMPLAPSILPPGETLRVPLTAPIQLSNRGGTITLQTPALLKADGVSYTESAALPEGTTVVF